MKKYQPQLTPEEQKDNAHQSQPQLYNIFEQLLRQFIGKDNVRPSASNETCCSAPTAGQPNHSCSSSMIESLFKIVQSQTKSLETLSVRVEEVVNKNRALHLKIKQLEGENLRLRNNQGGSAQPKGTELMQEVKIIGQQVNAASLLQILFGKKQYSFRLRLTEELEQPLYRERNFGLQMELTDLEGRKVVNSNKIPMSLALYSCENPPKFIEKNTAGHKMLKGYIDQSLIHGHCLFEKIQIREVTSHYRNGWVFLVVIPCMTPLGATRCPDFVDFKQVMPLVIGEVVVKAKKPKKKQEGSQLRKEDSSDEQPYDKLSE